MASWDPLSFLHSKRELRFSDSKLTKLKGPFRFSIPDILSDVLYSTQTLTDLDLSDSDIGGHGDKFVSSFADALSENTTLKRLDISSNNFRENQLCLVIRSLPTSLIEIDISNDIFYDHSGYNAPKCIREMLETNTRLEILILKGIERGIIHRRTALGEIFEGVRFNTTLKHLDVTGGYIYDAIESLNLMLRENKTLQHLDLSNCKDIFYDHFAYLRDAFIASNLRSLILSNLDIGISGCQNLGQILAANRILLELDLSDNPMGSRGAQYIAAGLKRNTTLEKLIMSSSHSRWGKIPYDIRVDGAVSIITAVASSNLKILNLSGHTIGLEGVKALSWLLLEINPLEELWVDSDTLSDDGHKLLAETLSRLGITLKRLYLGRTSEYYLNFYSEVIDEIETEIYYYGMAYEMAGKMIRLESWTGKFWSLLEKVV